MQAKKLLCHIVADASVTEIASESHNERLNICDVCHIKLHDSSRVLNESWPEWSSPTGHTLQYTHSGIQYCYHKNVHLRTWGKNAARGSAGVAAIRPPAVIAACRSFVNAVVMTTRSSTPPDPPAETTGDADGVHRSLQPMKLVGEKGTDSACCCCCCCCCCCWLVNGVAPITTGFHGCTAVTRTPPPHPPLL